jgi:branched-chain amino acid transport system substrate-binding protein
VGLALGCAMSAALAMSQAHAAGEIVIGLTYVDSGPFKTQGIGTVAAVEIAVSEINTAGGINGKKIRIVKFETGGDPKQAVVAVRKFAQDDKALAIIGPLSSGEAGAAFNVGERLGIVQIPNASSAPGLTKGKSYAFRVTEDEFKQFTRLLASMKRKNVPLKRVEIFYVSDIRIGQILGQKLMPAALKKFGINFGKPIGYSKTSFDMAPQATKAMKNKPTVISVAGFYARSAKVIKEMRRQGFKGRMIGSALFADPNNAELFGDAAANGTLFSMSYYPGISAKAEAFSKKFIAETKKRGIKRAFPHHIDAQTYDIVYLLKQVMEKAGVTGDPKKLAAERTAIRDTLKNITFNGVIGNNICFDGNGDAELPAYIIEMKAGKWTEFDRHPADKCK